MNSFAPVPTSQPHIPLDIQLAIVDMCPDVLTRLRLVSTHKALRRRGARLALRLPSAEVQLCTESAARSFFAFCSAQGLPREPSSPLTVLHTLDITLATVNPADIGNLVALLANVPQLTSLAPRDPEKALRRHHSLYAALQRLRTLNAFRVYKAEAVAFRLVSEIASALEDVTIHPYSEAPSEEDGAYELNINTVLARHKDTLTRVCIRRANVFGDEDEHEEDLVVFEKVQELVIRECALPGAAKYIKAFPNAVSLDVGTSLTTRTKWSLMLQEIHLNNLFAWVHDNPPYSERYYWDSLECVRGGLLDLYVFGFPSCAEALDIDGLIKDDWYCVPLVVRLHSPYFLRLSVSPSLQVDMWEDEWRELDTVKCLILQFVVEDTVDLKKLTETARRAVGSFVRCVVVFLDFIAQNEAARGRLQGIDHLSLRRIVEDRHFGPWKIVIRSPVETTYWFYKPWSRRKEWEVRHMPANTKFETMDCFPKELFP